MSVVQVTNRHPVRITAGSTVTNRGPDLVYYDSTDTVSSSNNEGSIASDAVATLADDKFIISVGLSTVDYWPVEAEVGQVRDAVTGLPLNVVSTSDPVRIVAAPTGIAATDRANIQAAIDAAPAGTSVLLRDGDYNVTGGTLEIKNKPVCLAGLGGMAQTNSSAPFIREASTRIYSTSNHPIIHIFEDSYTSIESQGSSLRDLAIEGLITAGSSQHGVWIDNRGTGCSFVNVMVAGTGGHGWLLGDSVAGYFANCMGHHCNGDGWRLDPAFGTDTANAAVTANVFSDCLSLGNTGNGTHLVARAVWGNLWIGGDDEGNTGYGFKLAGTATSGVRFNRVFGRWCEANTAGSVRIEGIWAFDNDLDFTRVNTTPSWDGAGTQMTNSVHYNDLSKTDAGQRKSWQHGFIRGGGLSSADMEAVVARTRDDAGDGKFRASSFVSTYGLTVNPHDPTPTATPNGTDAICLPTSRGITSRNAGNTANKQIFVMSGDVVYVAAANIPTEVEDELRVVGLVKWQTAGNEQTTVGAAGGASALPATPTKYLKVKDSTGATLVIPAYAAV